MSGIPTAVPSYDKRVENAREDAMDLAETGVVTEKQALAYTLRYAYGFTRKETAGLMNTSTSNMDNLYSRGKNNIDDAASATSLTAANDRSLNTEMGGELAQVMDSLLSKRFRCEGCSGIHTLSEPQFYGYPHSDGLMDGRGRKWWLIVNCPEEGYQNSWKTIRFNLIEEEDIKSGNVVIQNDATEETLSLELRGPDNEEVLTRDELEYGSLAAGVEDIRSPPHSITYYDFRENAYPKAWVGGEWDAMTYGETPSFTLHIEDDNDVEDPFNQTFSFQELGIEPDDSA